MTDRILLEDYNLAVVSVNGYIYYKENVTEEEWADIKALTDIIDIPQTKSKDKKDALRDLLTILTN